MTPEMISAIEEAIEELEMDYTYIGIRTQEEEFELGEIDHLSHIWDDGDDTGEELDGICAISVKADRWQKLVNAYYGDHMAILVGNDADYGEDVGEIIIKDAEVVKILA